MQIEKIQGVEVCCYLLMDGSYAILFPHLPNGEDEFMAVSVSEDGMGTLINLPHGERTIGFYNMSLAAQEFAESIIDKVRVTTNGVRVEAAKLPQRWVARRIETMWHLAGKWNVDKED